MNEVRNAYAISDAKTKASYYRLKMAEVVEDITVAQKVGDRARAIAAEDLHNELDQMLRMQTDFVRDVEGGAYDEPRTIPVTPDDLPY